MSDLILPDPRLEIPALFYPGIKPTGQVKINWSHPYTEHLIGSWIFQSGNIINLVENSPLGNGFSDFYIEADKLVSPSGQAASSAVLSHNNLDTSISGGSLVVGLRLDSYPTSYASVACLDEMQSNNELGFSLSYQSGNYMTQWMASASYAPTKRIAVAQGQHAILSASTNSARTNHQLIVNGKLATLTANDWWRHGEGLVDANSYNNTRGDLVGEYDFYHVFNADLSVDALMSLNINPYQFLIAE